MPSSDQHEDGWKSESDWASESSQDQARAAQVVSGIARLTSLLDSNFAAGRSLEETLGSWSEWQVDAVCRRYAHVLNARLSWWNYIFNPFWSVLFVLKRRGVFNTPASVPQEGLELLDYHLGRAEFVFSLSAGSRAFLRNEVLIGSISPRQAMTLVRSMGCRISPSGDISPAPIGQVGLGIGMIFGSVFSAFIFLFLGTIATELYEPCVRGCVVYGSIQLMVFSIYFAALAFYLSSGRNKSASLLLDLQMPEAKSRPAHPDSN